MNAGTKLATFALGLTAVLGAGAALGAVAGPIDVDDDPAHGDEHTAPEQAGSPPAAELPAGGLLVAQDGYRFAPESTALQPGTEQAFTFRVLGPDDEPVDRYEILHDKELHLVVVSRDLEQYAHVHPTRDAHGTWTVTLPPLPPGSYRAFADFRPAGHDQLTLGVDLSIAGAIAPVPPAEDADTAQVDGYTIRLDGDPSTGEALTITVRRDGEVITTEPYLGAAGHLVAIRDGDLAYLHVHPMDEEPTGPVRFAVEVPSAGRYALFFDFQHEGVVHTAPFLVTVDEVTSGGELDPEPHGGDH